VFVSSMSGIAGRKRKKGGKAFAFSPPSPSTRRSVPLLVVLLGKGRTRERGWREGEGPPRRPFLLLLSPSLRATCPRGGLPTPLLRAGRPRRGGRPRRSIIYVCVLVLRSCWSTLHNHPLSPGSLSLKEEREGLCCRTKCPSSRPGGLKKRNGAPVSCFPYFRIQARRWGPSLALLPLPFC
jgi:hypothetical protein